MLAAVPCSARLGLRHHCTLAALHEGDHVSAERTWPRSPRELAALQRHQAELRKLREQVVGWRREPGGQDPV